MKITMRKAGLIKSGLAASVLLFASGMALAQSVTLTASPQSATLPDGQIVPMWGYTCSSPSGTGVSCTAMNGSPQTGGTVWQPPLITVPAGSLTITLANNLPAKVPTSLVLVGQLGGGLGDVTQRVTMPSPPHNPQGTTWPGTLGGIDSSGTSIAFGSHGMGYTSVPAVTFSGGDGSGAQGTAVLTPSPIASVTMVIRGTGYTSAPAVSFIGNGSGAAGTAYLGVGSVTITASGRGSYSASATAPTVTFGLPNCTPLNATTCVRATGTAVMTTSGFGGTAASRRRVASITITNPGAGYTSAPAIIFSGAGTPAGGTAAATASLGVAYVHVDQGGSYAGAPTVEFAGGGSSGATATAAVAPTSVASVIVTNPGSGYTIPPNITFGLPNCTPLNATTCVLATATVSNLDAFLSAGTATFVPPAQADRVRSFGTEVLAGQNADLCWGSLCTGTTLKADLRPGTYLIESGTEPSIQGPMGLYGVLVVTDSAGPTTAYGTTFDKDVALLFSEIDPAQNTEVAQVVQNTNFSETAVWNGQPGQCGDVAAPATAHTCYPPAVNYSPRYYLINGVSFDATNAAASAVAVPAAGTQTRVLLRLVNAGLHMHVPSVVGAPMSLVAEDGNKLPGLPRKQNEVFLAAGKTYDVTIQPKQTTAGTYDAAALAVFDRALGVSTNNQLDGGMQAYLQVAGGALPATGMSLSAPATGPTYYCVAGTTLAITDPSRGVLQGVIGANGAALSAVSLAGVPSSAPYTNFSFQSNGTFTYSQLPTDTSCGGTFTYLVNGTASRTATITQCDAKIQQSGCALASAPTANPFVVVSAVASRYTSPPPGVLAHVTNPGGLALSAVATASVNADGSFVATGSGSSATCPQSTDSNAAIAALAKQVPAGATCVAVPYTAKDAQGQTSSASAYVAFLPGSNLQVAVKDGPTGKAVTDYRWIIEEDRTFWIDPKCQVNTSPRPAGCAPLPVESLGYNFHSANMPVIATGCVGKVSCEIGQKLQGADAVCDVGNGVCRTGATQKTPVSPAAVHLDPNKRYFISILPGDAINPTISGFGGTASDCGTFDPTTDNWKLYDPTDGSSGNCGHEMGGAQIAAGQSAVTVNLQQIPLPTAKISVQVFEDDNPLNGENDAGGGVNTLSPNEPGLGGFEIKLFDQAGQLGDNTGQITYDEFNEPVSNSLDGYIDPVTHLDACPITHRKDGLVGMIPTCPTYESDGRTLSPLAGQAVIANLYPGLYEIQAYPAADRIAKGEEWVQTNTLDGGKPHEAFIKPNEPGYFQEFGPGGYHVSIGFANPATINARKKGYCSSTLNANQPCTNTLNVQVTNNHMSRTPDQRTFDSGTYDHYSFTQCYVSIGPADAEDFAFQKCTADGKVSFTGMPPGVFKMTVFDQWNDIMLDGLVGTIEVGGGNTGNTTTNKVFPVTQWRTNLSTRTYIDTDGSGVSTDDKPGLALVNTNIRYRDGSIGFFNNTDLNGNAGFNEVFPFMNWLVVDTTQTRFKPTWTHVVYDAGGPVDCTTDPTILGTAAVPPCSTNDPAAYVANTNVRVPLPVDLRVPGAKYCDSADCPAGDAGGGASTGMLFPPQAFSNSIGWQGLLGQNTFMEFGVKPFKKATATTPAENGGIHGQVIYASTRPFDDPTLLLQLSWEPGIPHATVNLYSKSVDTNGNEVLKLVDSTQTASWDDWAQGFRKGADGVTPRLKGTGVPGTNNPDDGYMPNMNCPGQANDSPFFATLKNSKEWLDTKDPVTHGSTHSLAYRSQFKCYDGWSQLNQAQPAPYDGYYKFPSVTAIDPATGKPSHSNCAACITNPDDGNPMLPAGDYVVEVIPPAGYELVKEEDKNILMGDVYVAPVTQQFAGFGNIFILPDQAAVSSAYNPASPGSLNNTNALGSVTFPRHEGDTGSVEAFWPCVGALRQVPDFNSEFPGAAQASPFAGAMRRLCDRKEVQLVDESSTLAKFYLFSSTHIAGHFTGTITNDFASEFDPFSPQFGEKFGPPNLPVGLRDFNGNEVARVYSDQWGIYNGLYFSTWSPNPPNPTGYAPQMSIACMNDPGPIMVNGVPQTDPAYNPAYSNFCYEQPFMPGETTYMDTPVIPTQSFADGYNLPDTEYPDGTPAIKMVTSTAQGQGPWVPLTSVGTSATVTLTIGGVNRCQNGTNGCTNRSSITFPNGQVLCDNDNNPGPNCSSSTPSTRNNNVAAYIRSNIGTLMGAGYTASGSNAAVVITTSNHGTALNGTTVVSALANVTLGSAPPIKLTGGTDPVVGSPTLTITALGLRNVQNPNFSGPNASTAPYNQKTIPRTYSFGGTAGTVELIGPDGTSYPLTNVTWGDTTITGDVPAKLSPCAMQQPGQYALCGQLVITRGDNGKRSFDAITVTAGGSAPWVVTETDVTAPSGKSINDYGSNFGRLNLNLNAAHQSPLQVAIDSASPGDLILVQPGTYHENLIMWKPVRLQGVGAGAVTINADAHPAGHMDQWRRQVVCAFGLTLDGRPNRGNSQSAFDPTHTYTCPNAMFLKADRIPFEAITGWQASGNGNLAQLLQEPTLMGAYEGAGITVVGRGVREPRGSTDFWGDDPAAAGAFPAGAVYLTDGRNNLGDVSRNTDDCVVHAGVTTGLDYGTSNYRCNPSRIDGVSILNSSQGGGGVFVHGWAHNLEIANTRISANHGTLAGAINLGNGETPPVYINDGVLCGPGSVPESLCPPVYSGGGNPGVDEDGETPIGAAIPFGFDTNVRIHHNMLWNNASIGDALFTGTPSGAGAATVSAGGDNYQIDHNWIAGNLSTGDGAGIQSLGVTFNGKINNNVIMFNQSTNPTLPTNGGGIVIQGANEPRTLNGAECGAVTDADCPPGLGDGVGGGLVIDSNLVYGNSAESGTGGGIALEQINGSEIISFPRSSGNWYGVRVTNNIIANNVAGYDGGGMSMRDALKVSLINNTIVSNDTTASAGVLFKTLGAINASNPPPGCNSVTDPTLPQSPSCLGRDAPHLPQPSGLVTMAHTQNLNDAIAALPGSVNSNSNPKLICPSGFGYANGGSGANALRNADCRIFSRPALVNDLFWQNRTFKVDIVSAANSGANSGLTSQQNLVALSPQLNQAASGSCPSGAQYWDIGLRTDDVQVGRITAAANKLVVTNSILTGTSDIGTAQETVASITNKVGVSNPVNAQICNGARMPPEHCTDAGIDQNSPSCKGFNVPPGASETTSLSQVFVFNGIKPTATVDEGHNWLNLSYGPLSLARPNVSTPTAGEKMVAGQTVGTQEGAYSIPAGSPAISGGTTSGAPAADFYGNSRSGRNDIGAVQLVLGSGAAVRPSVLSFGTVIIGQNSVQTLTLTAGTTPMNGITIVATAPYTVLTGAPGDCGASLAATTIAVPSSCAIRVRFAPTAAGPVTGTVTVTSNVAVAGSPVALTGSGAKVDLTVTGSSTLLQFGDAFVGTTGATTQTVTLTNTTNPAGTVSNIAFSFSGPFSRSTTTPGSCPTTATISLGSGANCTIVVVFRPTALNPVSGAINVTAGTPFVVSGSPLQLTGNGLYPVMTPNPINFGAVPVGTAVTQTVTLSNANNINSNSLAFPITTVISVTGTGFTRQGGTCPTNATSSLAAGATCTIIVRFLPPAGANGTLTGSVAVTGNGGATVLVPVSLSGDRIQATYTATVTAGPVVFTDQYAGTTSASQSLTLTNTGNSQLTGLAYVASANFTHPTGGCGGTLNVGASCTIGVQFSPASQQTSYPIALTGTLTITGANGAVVTNSPVNLRGTAIARPVRYTGESGTGTLNAATQTLAFGNVNNATTNTLTVTVGTSPATFGTPTVTSSPAGAYTLGTTNTCTGGTQPKAANSTCTISVTFAVPAGTNAKTGTLSLPYTGGVGSPAVLNLTGN